jgi:tetratricopeptide (TPR) repeat protein
LSIPPFSASLFGVLLYAALFASCSADRGLPDPASERYQEAVDAFFTGVAASQAGEDGIAEAQLLRVTEVAPGEPAAWANLGLMALRRNEPDIARQRMDRAEALAPEHAGIQLLLAQFENAEGHFHEAIDRLRRTAERDPGSLRVHYALYQALERQSGEGWTGEARALLTRMRALRPDDTVLILDEMYVAALEDDVASVREGARSLQDRAARWPERAQAFLDQIAEANAAGRHDESARGVIFLQNVLRGEPQYRRELRAVQTPSAEMGELLTAFVRLPAPEAVTAPADTSLALTLHALESDAASQDWIGALYLGGDAMPVVTTADGQRLRIGGRELQIPGRPAEGGRHGLAALDYNFNFLTDLAVAGREGIRLYEQDSTGTFEDVSDRAFPVSAIGDSYTGVWSVDFDLDGDLDLLLGRSNTPPLLLRNNGDGTFAADVPFDGIHGLQHFTWADVHADGAPDPAFLDADGRLHIMVNERRGVFSVKDVPYASGRYLALTSADLDQDGRIDLLVLDEDGTIYRLSNRDGSWERTLMAQWQELPSGLAAGDVNLFVADLDNNGALDLITSAAGQSRLWLNHGRGQLEQLGPALAVDIFGAADISGNGRLDLLSLSEGGAPQFLASRGEKDYHWQILRPRSAQALGDQRVNSFGIGGELEVRSGLSYQKLLISEPRVHVGLGNQEQARLVRIVWPNGDIQAEFNLQADQEIHTPQRLKGSCPWIFTYDGEGMRFITDFIWRSPLGLSINAQETAGVMMTEDWIKIRGDQLVPREGYYDVRITAELWETHFFDYIGLLVVDHPADTEIFVDERFVFPSPLLGVYVTSPPQRIAGAWDHRGREVTGIVAQRDGRHLDTFDLTAYQGLAEDHFVEIDLGEKALEEKHLLLIASGWVRPTDSSINVALSQGTHGPPAGLSLEVPDGEGGWTVAHPDLGFPAGKDKTVVIDLQDVFSPGMPPRLRLRTTMEIYWDAVEWAGARPEVPIDTLRLAPEVADLRYRGFSDLIHLDRSRAEIPVYEELAGTAPRWRDLIGYHTRFGDVRALLQDVDDRYVIMNAGDEMRLRFPVPHDPPPGWQRNFVLIGDGWVKDGDLNTAFSRTVLPLPTRTTSEYSTPPGDLADDPVYRRFPEDWREFHTRFVTPEPFIEALVPR